MEGQLFDEPGLVTPDPSGLFHVLLARDSSRGPFCLARRQDVGFVASVVESLLEPEVLLAVASGVDGDTGIASLSGLDHLMLGQREQVQSLLNKVALVFSQGEGDIGCAGVTQHRIELHDSTPIRQKPRRFPEPVALEIERQCEELRQLNIIDYSRYPWSSPVVPVKKKDGTLRLCVDYRQLNKVTKADRFPIPNMSDLVFNLGGRQWFSTLDLVKGYYQVPLDPASAEYTAFSTARNHYQFNRLSFGLKNAPGAFQREMQMVLRDFNTKEVVIYIDDILVMSDTFERHLDLFGKILATLENYHIKIKAEKCCWFRHEVEFLGHVIGRNGLRKSDVYMDTIRKYPRPKTVGELRSFLGLVNFQRKFVAGCALLSKPLTCLTSQKDKVVLEWSFEMTESFEQLKDSLCANIELAYPDYGLGSEKLELATDASGYGSGACLAQSQQGAVRVIAYASMTFSSAQCAYSTIERELAAIRWAIKIFRPFLYGVPFLLFTDHRPLVYLSNMSRQNARLMRTLNELAEYDFEVRYRAGKENCIPDTLSRLHVDFSIVNEGVPVDLPDGVTVICEVVGGGDSMVESLFIVLQRRLSPWESVMPLPACPGELRIALCDELVQHPHRYGLDKKANLSQVRLMRFPGQLPSELFLAAAANLFKLEVWVHSEFVRPFIYGPSEAREGRGCVHIQCRAGVHYNPLWADSSYDGGRHQLGGVLQCPGEEHVNSEDDPELEEAEVAFFEGNEDRGDLLCSVKHTSCLPCRVSIRVGSYQFCALVDTGAQLSLVSQAVLERLGVNGFTLVNRTLIRIRTLGGFVASLGRVQLQVIVPTCQPLYLTFAVVPEDCMPFCFIVGGDLLDSLGTVIDYWQSGFFFGQGRHVPFLPCDSKAQQHELCLVQQGDVECDEGVEPVPGLLSMGQVRLCQQSDYTIRLVSRVVREGAHGSNWKAQVLASFRRHVDQLGCGEDGILCFKRNGCLVPVVSFAVLVEIVIHVHFQQCHPGRNKMGETLGDCIWHPKLLEVVSDVCRACPGCQYYKVASVAVAPPVVKVEADGPYDLVAVDLVQLPRTAKGNIGCLVLVDHWSKWLACVPIRNKQAKTVSISLEQRILPMLPCIPTRLLSDNGHEFTAGDFEDVLGKYNIQHIYSSPYKPASNGAVERVNRTVIEMLRCLGEGDRLAWDEQLPRAVISYNNAWHSQIGMSPSQLILTRAHDRSKSLVVSANTRRVWKEGHPSFKPFRLGDSVLRKMHHPGNLTVNKFKARYGGPYQVVGVHRKGLAYEVARTCQSGEREICRVHYSHLKKWIPCPAYINRNAHLYAVWTAYAGSPEVMPAEEESRVGSPELITDVPGEQSTADEASDEGELYARPIRGCNLAGVLGGFPCVVPRDYAGFGDRSTGGRCTQCGNGGVGLSDGPLERSVSVQGEAASAEKGDNCRGRLAGASGEFGGLSHQTEYLCSCPAEASAEGGHGEMVGEVDNSREWASSSLVSDAPVSHSTPRRVDGASGMSARRVRLGREALPALNMDESGEGEVCSTPVVTQRSMATESSRAGLEESSGCSIGEREITEQAGATAKATSISPAGLGQGEQQHEGVSLGEGDTTVAGEDEQGASSEDSWVSGLSPLQKAVQETRAKLEEVRRKSSARLIAARREYLINSPANKALMRGLRPARREASPGGRRTRSQGPVPEETNVQEGTLEYRVRRAVVAKQEECKVTPPGSPLGGEE